jgi:tetratricopeptide (TPR) repeat protein
MGHDKKHEEPDAMTRARSQFSPVRGASIITLLALFAILFADRCFSQERPKPMLIIDEVQSLDEGANKRGIAADALTGTLRLLFATEPSVQVLNAEGGLGLRAPQNSYVVSSSIRSIQDAIVWLGTFRRIESPDGAGQQSKPVALGPITIAERGGLQPSALTEIVSLIRRQIQDDIAGVEKKYRYRIGCFTVKGASVAVQLANQVRLELDQVLARDFGLRNAGMDACKAAGRPVAEPDIVIVQGAVLQFSGALALQAELLWNSESKEGRQVTPLPGWREETGQRAKPASQNMRTLSRAIAAAMETPQADIAAAHNAVERGAKETLEQAAKFLDLGRAPYLALAMLQQLDGKPTAELSYQLGRVHHATGNAPTAEAHFRKAIELAPKDWSQLPKLKSQLGIVLLEQQKFSEAETLFAESLSQLDDPAIRVRYLRTLYLLGKSAAASEQISLLREKPPVDPEVLSIAVRLSLDSGDTARALEFLQAGITDPQADKSVFVVMAKILATNAIGSKDGRAQDAKTALEIVLRNSPEMDPEAYLLLGRATLMTSTTGDSGGTTKDAIDAFEQAKRLAKRSAKNSPDLAVVALELAEAYFLNGDYQRAAETAQEFLKTEAVPDFGASSYYPVAHLLVVAGDYLRGALTDDPAKELLHRTQHLKNAPPQLVAKIPTFQGKFIDVPVARWSFDTFDNYACKKLSEPQRSVVRGLSEGVQFTTGERLSTRGCS